MIIYIYCKSGYFKDDNIYIVNQVILRMIIYIYCKSGYFKDGNIYIL